LAIWLASPATAPHDASWFVTGAPPEFGKVEPVWLPESTPLNPPGCSAFPLILDELSVEEVEELRFQRSKTRFAPFQRNHPGAPDCKETFSAFLDLLRGGRQRKLGPATEAEEMARKVVGNLPDGRESRHAAFAIALGSLFQLARHASRIHGIIQWGEG